MKSIQIISQLLTNHSELMLTIRMLQIAVEAGYTHVMDKEYGTENLTLYTIEDAIAMLSRGDTLPQPSEDMEFMSNEIP